MTNTVDGVDLGKLSAFEVSFQMQKLAQDNKDHLSYLNAGRGNPNWINAETRLAFARLMEWGCLESQRTYS